MSTMRRGHGVVVVALAGLLAGGCATSRHAGHEAENVGQSAGKTVDDASITVAVKSALLKEPGVKSAEISVETKDGVVTLNGTQPRDAMAKDAEKVAERVEGVRGVVNHIGVEKK